MDTYKKSMARRFRAALTRRVSDLNETLARESDGIRSDAAAIDDFKDAAAREVQAGVDGAHADHAAHELVRVQAALRRISDGSYGLCVDCGEPIALARLDAMPAAARCADCQSVRELTAP